MSWTAGATETAWNVEYGAAGFAQGSGTVVNVTANQYSMTSLTPNTSYDVYIQSDCGSGDVSAWAGPFNFSTSCASFTAPYSQNFDAVADPDYDQCWSELISSTSTFPWINSENSAFDPQRSAPNSIEFYSSSASVDDMLYIKDKSYMNAFDKVNKLINTYVGIIPNNIQKQT